MKFHYVTAVGLTDSKGRLVKRPVITIELQTKDGQTLEVPALIDSGADKTLVNIEYAEQLGIKLSTMPHQVRGIGKGTAESKAGNLPFKILETDIKLDVPASYIDSENVTILLGQEAFFDKSAGTFELIEIK